MKPMYADSDLAAMDPLVLMKNLDHVRMTSRGSAHPPAAVHLYTPKRPAAPAHRLLRRGRAAIEAEMARGACAPDRRPLEAR
jgi:hypothetical protein